MSPERPLERARLRTVRLTVLLALLFGLAACATSVDEEVVDSSTVETDGDATEDTSSNEESSSEDRTLRVAIPDDVETLDPAFGQAELTNLVLKNTYLQPIQYLPGEVGPEGYAYADTTAFEGQVLESWEFQDGGATILMTLRQGLEFPASGNPVTVDDFVWTIERALGTQAGPAWVWGNLGVTSMDQVEVVDDWTVRITGARPSAIAEPLLRDQTIGLIDSVAVQAQATEEDPWSLTWLSQNYAGNGRYFLDEWEQGTRVVLRSNPTWPGEQPYFETVELLVVPESSNRLALLQNGDVDIAYALSAQELNQAEAGEGVSVLSVRDRAALNVGMNMRSAPFDDVRVRQALAYAVPYDDIVNGVLDGRAVKSEGPMSVNSRFYDLYELGDFATYEYDPDRARELLDEAGYGDGFSFELIIPQGLPFVEATAANLRSAFEDVGVDMTIAPVSSAAMAERLAQRDFEAFLRGWLLDYVDDPYYHFFLWWGTDTVLNWVGYSNPTVDAALEETAEIVGDEERREPYRDAISQVIEDAPMLWIANGDSTLAMGDDITGYVHHPDQLLWFASLAREG